MDKHPGKNRTITWQGRTQEEEPTETGIEQETEP